MHIELTDHLRCPADHPASFLVLIPAEMTGRDVRRGVLGCPVCRREYPIVDGVVHFTPASPAVGPPVTAPGAEALAAFLGVEGPGGFVALVGSAASFAAGLGGLLPGVQLVSVNPPEGVAPALSESRLLSPVLPFKAASLRGIVVGAPYGAEPLWIDAAVGSVLPGLRVAGQGPAPGVPRFERLGEAAGWWVGRVGK